MVVWSSEENFNCAGTDYNIFGVISSDFGTSWCSVQVLNCFGSIDGDGNPFMTVDTNNELYADIVTDNAGVWYLTYISSDAKTRVSKSTNLGADWTGADIVSEGLQTSGGRLVIHRMTAA